MMLLFCLKSISNTIVCNPQKKNILKSICQWCNNLELTRIFNGPPDIDRTTQSATMGGPVDHPWFLLIPHTDYASVKWASIDSDNGLSPGRRQAIIWSNAGILSIGLLGANFSEIRIGILSFWFKKMHLKLSSAEMAAFCPEGDELMPSFWSSDAEGISSVPSLSLMVVLTAAAPCLNKDLHINGYKKETWIKFDNCSIPMSVHQSMLKSYNFDE